MILCSEPGVDTFCICGTAAGAMLDGDQPYHMPLDKVNAALAETPLDSSADAVYYYYDDRNMIVFETPFQ